MVPFSLLSWWEYPSDDNTVYDRVGDFHLTVKEFENRCFHGDILISYRVLIFQIIKVYFLDWIEADHHHEQWNQD